MRLAQAEEAWSPAARRFHRRIRATSHAVLQALRCCDPRVAYLARYPAPETDAMGFW